MSNPDPSIQQALAFLKTKTVGLYKDVKIVMDLVHKNKEGGLNFLGQYKNQLAQDWYLLIRLY